MPVSRSINLKKKPNEHFFSANVKFPYILLIFPGYQVPEYGDLLKWIVLLSHHFALEFITILTITTKRRKKKIFIVGHRIFMLRLHFVVGKNFLYTLHMLAYERICCIMFFNMTLNIIFTATKPHEIGEEVGIIWKSVFGWHYCQHDNDRKTVFFFSKIGLYSLTFFLLYCITTMTMEPLRKSFEKLFKS